MLNRKFFRLRIIATILILNCFVFAQQNTGNNNSVNTADEQALHWLVNKYVDAYVKKDLNAFAALWSERSPMIASYRENLQRMFATYHYQFTEPLISRVKIDGDKGSMRITSERTTHDSITNFQTKSRMKLDLSLVREGGNWKIWVETPAVSSLVALLSSAKTDAERQALLADDSENVTSQLLHMLSSQSDRAYTHTNYPQALSLLQSARLVSVRLGDKKEEANSWHNIGIIQFLQLHYGQALAAYQKSLKLEEELGRRPEIARSLTSIGLVLSAQGQYKDALESFHRSLALSEQLNHKAEVAQALENIGNVHYEQGHYTRASEFYQKSVRFYEETGAKTTVAHRLLKIAKTEYEQGNDVSAIGFYHQALARFEEAKARDGRGYALHSIANIYYSQGDYPQAMNFYQRSLKIEEVEGNQKGMASALQGIGLVHSLNGNYALSLEAYEKNLEIAQLLGNSRDCARAFQKVGGAHFSLGKYPIALEAYQKALALWEEVDDQQETAGAMLDVGITYATEGDYAKALEHYQKGRELFESAGNLAGVASALLNTSVIHYVQSDFAKTLEIAEQAAKFAKLGDEMDLFWQARHRMGKASYRLEQFEPARQAFSEAITTIETKLSPSGRTQQPRFYESKLAPYLAMVDVHIALNRGNEAFNFAERARSRILLGIIQSAKIWINKTMTPRERERERQFLTEINTLTAQIYREYERESPNKTRIDSLNTRLQKTQLDYQAFKSRLYAAHPQLKVMRGEGKPLTAEEAVALATDARKAILDFVETEEQVYLFVFAGNRAGTMKGRRQNNRDQRTDPPVSPLKIYILSTNRSELASRISSFQQLIAGRSESIQPLARELFELLIKPAQEQLKGKSQLIISPDAVLWGLPFRALQPSDNRFLIEDYAITYTPSLTVLSAIQKSRNRSPRSAGKIPAVLAFGSPTPRPDATERIKTILLTEQIAQLSKTQSEVESLGELYGAESSRILSGAEASEDRLKVEAGKYRLLHLAARGVLIESSPLFSLIALSSTDETKDDGLFEARELLDLDLKAEMIVVSASELASPKFGAGRAMSGLTWASFVAGCPSMLISRWPVDSSSTVKLMLEFYRGLKTSRLRSRSAISKATAWQSSIKQLFTRGDYRHPYFWSGFEMLGDGR